MENETPKGFMTSKQVREFLAISHSTLNRLRREGEIEFCRLAGNSLRYRRESIEKYYESRMVVSHDEAQNIV